MRHTAVHIHSSPNPAQLEMRIPANHGADKRFAFLRGRWSHAWRLAKYKVRLQTEEAAKEKDMEQKSDNLVALAGYGDSDEDGSEVEGPVKSPSKQSLRLDSRQLFDIGEPTLSFGPELG
ncbi:hypothetical protein M378DRAFT_164155 [Amanita muscaria Koide BX008]|uniref:Uncharacterized protein n=1 Tax=Amanita muscaria (strain Koide BX008) TaxID=946122 RepID=A0A0C2TAH9_AMAMK|nr:hypothetical protein M378DRAFT_164155 [Amanita muscaria Koide BX008]